MARLLRFLGVLGALSLATACGSSSSHGAPSPQGLRVFDSTGAFRGEITLSSIVRTGIRVYPAFLQIGGEAEIYLPLSSAGKAKCDRLTHAWMHRIPRGRDRHAALRVEIAGHLYTVERTDDSYFSGFPDVICGAIDVKLRNTTPEEIARVLKIAKIVTIPVGARRQFVLPGETAPGTGCLMDFDDPFTNVDCFAWESDTPLSRATVVRMGPSGKLDVCHGVCIGNPEGGATLKNGNGVKLGPFHCMARKNRVRCIVTKTGRGFVLGLDGVKRVR